MKKKFFFKYYISFGKNKIKRREKTSDSVTPWSVRDVLGVGIRS